MGLEVAGVDMLEARTGPKIMEVNSSPGFEGLEAATGVDIASAYVEHAVEFAPRPPLGLRGRPPRLSVNASARSWSRSSERTAPSGACSALPNAGSAKQIAPPVAPSQPAPSRVSLVLYEDPLSSLVPGRRAAHRRRARGARRRRFAPSARAVPAARRARARCRPRRERRALARERCARARARSRRRRGIYARPLALADPPLSSIRRARARRGRRRPAPGRAREARSATRSARPRSSAG